MDTFIFTWLYTVSIAYDINKVYTFIHHIVNVHFVLETKYLPTLIIINASTKRSLEIWVKILIQINYPILLLKKLVELKLEENQKFKLDPRLTSGKRMRHACAFYRYEGFFLLLLNSN